MWIATATGDPTTTAFTDPSFWLNAGALGVIAGLFVFGILHSTKELDRVEAHTAKTVSDLIKTHEGTVSSLIRAHEETTRTLKEAHAATMERMDDQVRALILEKDAANAERNKAVDVMKDFTLMAGAILNNQPWPPRRPERGAGSER